MHGVLRIPVEVDPTTTFGETEAAENLAADAVQGALGGIGVSVTGPATLRFESEPESVLRRAAESDDEDDDGIIEA